MARVFISHSSNDKGHAIRLAEDLRAFSHDPWLDEWEIKVGECIVSKIEEGIEKCEFVAILLTEHSVMSGWVEREWKAKYWNEVSSGKTMVLPLKFDDCAIPALLKSKKYADFRSNYSVGISQLVSTLQPSLGPTPPGSSEEILHASSLSSKVSSLLSKVQSRSFPLAECVADALALSQEYAFQSLESFCKNELLGWSNSVIDSKKGPPSYRLVEVFVSPFAEINTNYFGWGQDPSAVLGFMRKDPKRFFPYKLMYGKDVAGIEAEAEPRTSNSIMSITMTQRDVFPDPPDPNAPVFAYGPPDSLLRILEGIRRELTNQLLSLLPEIKGENNV